MDAGTVVSSANEIKLGNTGSPEPLNNTVYCVPSLRVHPKLACIVAELAAPANVEGKVKPVMAVTVTGSSVTSTVTGDATSNPAKLPQRSAVPVAVDVTSMVLPDLVTDNSVDVTRPPVATTA